MHECGWRCLVCGAWFDEHSSSCTGCLGTGTVLRIGRRAVAEIDAAPELTTAADLAKAAWTPVISAAYGNLRLGAGALVVVYGPPGGGKSTFATRLLDGFRGPVVLQSVEEAPGPSLHARLHRCRVRRADFVIAGRASVDQVANVVRDKRAVGLVVDSVQIAAFTPDELRHLLLVLPTLRVVVGVAQVNKAGRIEGRERLLHEADVAIQCEGLRWAVTKSRYQPSEVGGDICQWEGDDAHA
jgi:predicted ATP-dependent serine protease